MKGQLLNKILFILLLFPGYLLAQTTSSPSSDITGLWKGALYNDTTKQSLPYEIAISEEKGKLTGYSYTQFDIDGKKEMGVKKIKLKISNDQIIIEDVALISNTFNGPPPRRVRVQSIVQLSVKDTMMQLSGRWSTNRTREYLPLTGSLQLERRADYKPQTLFKILTDLKLENELSFVKAERMPAPVVAVETKPVIEDKAIAVSPPQSTDPDKPKQQEKPAVVDTKPVEQPVVAAPVVKPEPIPEPEKIFEKLIANNLATLKNKPSGELIKVPAKINILPLSAKRKESLVAALIKKEIIPPVVAEAKPVIPAPVTKQPAPGAIAKAPARQETKPPVVVVQKPVVTEKPKPVPPPATVAKEPVKPVTQPVAVTVVPPQPKKEIPVAVPTPGVPAAAANVAERKMKSEQSVYFESDSLVLTLYDNGDVDGDTVSVLMNGQIIFAKQGLSTKANSKTVYIDKATTDSLSMVMYAENLGSIPPNTGLLIIMDGEKRHEVRFSADLKTNAAILLRRKIK